MYLLIEIELYTLSWKNFNHMSEIDILRNCSHFFLDGLGVEIKPRRRAG